MSSVAHTRPYAPLQINRIGLWLFILSESMLFIGLLAVRLFLQGTDLPDEQNQPLGLMITSILLLSSFTAYRAETAIAHDDRRLFTRNLVATLLLGGLFIVGVGVEWQEAFHFFPPGTGFGTVFFTMTGLHAFHVMTGLIFLSVVLGNARRGAYSGVNYWPAEAAVKYWHFVDVVWVFFYPALYLIS